MVIKKTVKLDFLGEDYKEAYIIFKGIGLTEFEDHVAKAQELDKKGGAGSFRLMANLLASHFISGKGPNESGAMEELKSDDISNLDIDTALKVFQLLTGQELPPK